MFFKKGYFSDFSGQAFYDLSQSNTRKGAVGNALAEMFA